MDLLGPIRTRQLTLGTPPYNERYCSLSVMPSLSKSVEAAAAAATTVARATNPRSSAEDVPAEQRFIRLASGVLDQPAATAACCCGDGSGPSDRPYCCCPASGHEVARTRSPSLSYSARPFSALLYSFFFCSPLFLRAVSARILCYSVRSKLPGNEALISIAPTSAFLYLGACLLVEQINGP